MRLYVSTDGDRISRFGSYSRQADATVMEASWDGLQAEVKLIGVENINAITDFFITPDNGLSVFGPYIAQRMNTTGEERQRTLRGRLDLNIDYLLVGSDAEAAIADRFDRDLGALLSVTPYTTWQDGYPTQVQPTGNGGRPETIRRYAAVPSIRELIYADLRRANSLSQIANSLRKWGIVPIPYVTTDRQYRLIPMPTYPLAHSLYVSDARLRGKFLNTDGTLGRRPEWNEADLADLDLGRVQTDVDVAVPDAQNQPEGYRTRRIESSNRFALALAPDTVFFAQGLTGPPIYLPQSDIGVYANIAADLARWELQNTAQELTVTRWPTGDTYIAPRHRFRYGGAEWLVTDVDHRYSAEQGYSQRITAALWQGYGPLSLAPALAEEPSVNAPIRPVSVDALPENVKVLGGVAEFGGLERRFRFSNGSLSAGAYFTVLTDRNLFPPGVRTTQGVSGLFTFYNIANNAFQSMMAVSGTVVDFAAVGELVGWQSVVRQVVPGDGDLTVLLESYYREPIPNFVHNTEYDVRLLE